MRGMPLLPSGTPGLGHQRRPGTAGTAPPSTPGDPPPPPKQIRSATPPLPPSFAAADQPRAAPVAAAPHAAEPVHVPVAGGDGCSYQNQQRLDPAHNPGHSAAPADGHAPHAPHAHTRPHAPPTSHAHDATQPAHDATPPPPPFPSAKPASGNAADLHSSFEDTTLDMSMAEGMDFDSTATTEGAPDESGAQFDGYQVGTLFPAGWGMPALACLLLLQPLLLVKRLSDTRVPGMPFAPNSSAVCTGIGRRYQNRFPCASERRRGGWT